jgi:hypothetical protein
LDSHSKRSISAHARSLQNRDRTNLSFWFFFWVLFADEYTCLHAYIFIADFLRLNSEAQCRHQNMRRFLPRLSSHPLRSRCRLSADLRARASGSTREGHRCMRARVRVCGLNQYCFTCSNQSDPTTPRAFVVSTADSTLNIYFIGFWKSGYPDFRLCQPPPRK